MLIPGFAHWFLPLPALVVACLALIVVLLAMIRRRRPGAADQVRLNRLFATVPREAIRNIRGQDFSGPWPDELIDPVASFYRNLGEVEHRFDLRKLEKRRARLHRAAGLFLEEEAAAFDWDGGPQRRFLGVTPARLETASSVERERFERRRSKLHAAALAFLQAHDALVEEAKDRGFDLGALEGDLPTRSWTGADIQPQVVRARWPGE
jgi:hypothetical protein